MKIDDLTIGEAKQLSALFGSNAQSKTGIQSMVGKKVIVRTYSAGVHFGELYEKDGTEVILRNSRRMWLWCAKESISLSGCALYGINDSKSRIAPPVEYQWLDAIEIIPCSPTAIGSIEGAPNAETK